MKKRSCVSLLTIVMILLLAGAYLSGCGKTSRAEPEVAAEEAEKAAEAAEAAEEAEETAEAEEASEPEQTSEEEEETAEETAETEEADEAAEAEEAADQEVSEEERLAVFARSLEKLDPTDRQDWISLSSELVRVKDDEEDASYQKAVIQHLLSGKTEQVSPCKEGDYPVVRVFKGFTLVDAEGRVEAYQDSRHLHFKGEGWEILNGHGIETFEESTIVWRLGNFPFWALARKGEQVYLFHWLETADAAVDPVFANYDIDIRQRVKAIVAQCEEEGKVSQENSNLLESIAFQLNLKPVSSDDYCIVQYMTREACRGTDWSRRTLINLKVDDEGIPQSINSEEMSLIICKEDLSLKVTMVTEPVTLERDDG
jgi:hypothetical protein